MHGKTGGVGARNGRDCCIDDGIKTRPFVTLAIGPHSYRKERWRRLTRDYLLINVKRFRFRPPPFSPTRVFQFMNILPDLNKWGDTKKPFNTDEDMYRSGSVISEDQIARVAGLNGGLNRKRPVVCGCTLQNDSLKIANIKIKLVWTLFVDGFRYWRDKIRRSQYVQLVASGVSGKR